MFVHSKRHNLPKYFFCAVAALVFTSQNIFADNIPVGQSSGAEAQRFKDQTERLRKMLEAGVKPPYVYVPPKEEKPAGPNVPFILKEVTVTGSTIFKSQELALVYQPYLNKEVAIKDLNDIAKKIEEMYAKKGCLTTNAFIPPQDIKDGKTEIKVVEGKVGQLKIEGNKYFSTELIQKYFHSKPNEILNINTLQRDILRLNMGSDLEVKTLLAAGKSPETSDITLKVKDRFPWHVGVSEDNQGTRLTGKLRTSYTARCSNLTGRGDTFFESTLFTNNSSGESTSYSIPLDTYGTKFYFDTTYFRMKLGKEFASNNIKGQTQIYSPHVSWELALTENYQATANLGLDIKSVTQRQNGQRSSDDQLRLPWFGFDFAKQGANAQTNFSPKFIFGTSQFLGASAEGHPSASRAGTGGSFVKYSQALTRVQKMPWNSYITARTQFQAASHTLPSSEEIQIGGVYSVRGYPEGDYLADTGGYMNLDWILPNYLIPENWKLKGQETPLRYQIEPDIFIDCGGGKLKKILNGEREEQFLSGAGAGLQFNFKCFTLKTGWAKAIGGDRPVHGSGASTFYFTFNSEM
ncbi:MAG: ShlB/FhaC/HecB family hemolysin secretion/activation protein [Candidatus Omnitrophica bacterium]|nr:ShlB/FhaC/HecB family hemolysin secretion/activation protein [Candidatus Omnitrophota bacterium]